MKHGIISVHAVVCCLAFCLIGCTEAPPPETVPPTVDPNTLVEAHTVVVEGQEDLEALDIYPNLRHLDLRGSTCYAEILAYMTDHPEVTVLYDVAIGDTVFPMDTVSLTLADGSYTFEELLEKLPFLPGVTEISLPTTTLTREQQLELAAAYPEIALSTTVSLLGQEIPGDTSLLDLSFLMPEQVTEAAQALSRLTGLTEVELMNEDGKSSLSMTDVKVLMDAAPSATVRYTFRIFGKTISTTDERVEFLKGNIGNSGVEQLRQALAILPNCTYFLVERCGVSSENLAKLREEYPERNVVWRIYYADGQSCLTDVTVFRTIGDLFNHNVGELKYLKDVVYLDIGHCYHLSDISWIANMPKLKVCIISDCHTPTLEPFRNCKELEWLEIVNCNAVTDLSPLADCVSLRGVNMSFVFSVTDLSPLYSLDKLERLFMGRNKFPKETIDAVKAALPNCWVTDYAENVQWCSFNYSIGWRLDDEHTFAEWYAEIRPIFGYTRKIY